MRRELSRHVLVYILREHKVKILQRLYLMIHLESAKLSQQNLIEKINLTFGVSRVIASYLVRIIGPISPKNIETEVTSTPPGGGGVSGIFEDIRKKLGI